MALKAVLTEAAIVDQPTDPSWRASSSITSMVSTMPSSSPPNSRGTIRWMAPELRTAAATSSVNAARCSISSADASTIGARARTRSSSDVSAIAER